MKRHLASAATGTLAIVAIVLALTTSSNAPAPHAITVPKVADTAPACPVGNSHIGCAVAQSGETLTPRTVPAGPRFIDVSDYQPTVDWARVKAAGISAVVVKAGEGLAEDPTFAEHVTGAKQAGLEVLAYWFERPDGCTAEASAIDRVVPKGMRVIFDEEVPGLQGYAACELAPVAAHTGLDPFEYTSPGTHTDLSEDGHLGLWEATYGPTLDQLWQPLEAWQYTDTATVPGIAGDVDESVDYGLLQRPVIITPPSPRPVCWGAKAELSNPTCKVVRPELARYSRARAASDRVLANTRVEMRAADCRRPYRRAICVRAGRTVALMNHRVAYFSALATGLFAEYR